MGMRIWENSKEIEKEFKAIAKWIDEELPGMIDAYKEKYIKIVEKAGRRRDPNEYPLSSIGENEKISRACKNVYFADTYFDLMETEFARFLIDFEEIEEDEEDKEED